MHDRRIASMAAIVALLGVAISPAAAGARAIEPATRIDAVTVHPGGTARVTRAARHDVAGGDGVLRFAGLPTAIVDDSVRVAVDAGPVAIGAVEVAREPVGTASRQREAALREELRRLQGERRAALDAKAAAEAQLRFIEGLAELPTRDGAPASLAGDTAETRWPALWQAIGEGARTTRAGIREAEASARQLDEDIGVVQAKLDRLGRDRPEAVTVTVPYSARDAGPLDLRLSYRVRGPRWVPRYETRLDTAAGEVTLVRTARVQQATGEGWSDVALSLSTSRPVRGNLPQPSTWWIDLVPEDEADAVSRMESAQAPTLAQGEGGAGGADAVQTLNAEFSASYRIPGRVSVPAGNQPRELRLGSHTLSAAVAARVHPQRDTRAWLTARTTWSGEGPLPPGKVARFRDGAFIGEGTLESWAPGDERSLPFGVDPRVVAAFERLRDEAGESGVLTSRRSQTRHYRLELTNRHDRPLTTTAVFRIPVPRDEDIEVEPWFPTPPDTSDRDGKRGVHAWSLELGTQSTHALELGYEVTYPAGRAVRGL